VNAAEKIACKCGKMLARYEDGKIYLWCKSCRKEIAIPLNNIAGLPTMKSNKTRAGL
jgi:hypothetical protein